MGASAPKQVSDLVERFDRDRKVFMSPDYKEEQLRVEFLNGPCLTIRHPDLASAAPVGQRVVRTSPGSFFTALGWDSVIPSTRVRSEIEKALSFPTTIGDAES